MRCGYAGPPKQIGCRRIICEECVAGYWVTGATQRPLCKNCVTVK